jgi:hypothetical protein
LSTFSRQLEPKPFFDFEEMGWYGFCEDVSAPLDDEGPGEVFDSPASGLTHGLSTLTGLALDLGFRLLDVACPFEGADALGLAGKLDMV